MRVSLYATPDQILECEDELLDKYKNKQLSIVKIILIYWSSSKRRFNFVLSIYKKINISPLMKQLYNIVLSVIVVGIALYNTFLPIQQKEAPDETVQQLSQDAPADVTTTPLKSVDFEHELVSNGKIKAQTVAELKFQTAEVIAKIYVKNGSHVQNGQKIAELDTYSLQNRLNQAKDALERSRLEFQDVLIGQGYKLDNPDVVPEDVMQLAKVKSGYNGAQTQFEMAKYDLEKASLVAPISWGL